MPEPVLKPRSDTGWHRFIVEGRGEFPMDMLRHSAAWPADSTDACAIAAHGRRRIVLTTCQPFHIALPRWASFGWKVIAGYHNGWPCEMTDVDAIVLGEAA